jgi:hypothetical protein
LGTLTITKTYAAGEILLEVDIDAFRDGLLTLFNTDKFASGNFSSLALTNAYFTNNELTSADDTALTFGTDSDGTIKVVSSTKDLEFNTVTASTTLTFKAISKTIVFKTTQVDVPGDVILGSGDSGYGILHLLSSYRKPVLTYSGSSTIYVENNTGTTNETLISFPKYLIGVTEALSGSEKYRKMSVLSTANGYVSTHTGAAIGGLRVGLTATANTWYPIYAVRVRYGTNAGNKFILVGDNIFPTQGNYATLDSRYGSGEWVYLGVIRYGFGVVGSTTAIVPFVYTNKGWCYFTSGDPGVTSSGVTLAQSTTNADDAPFYTLADGLSGAVVPLDAVTMAQWQLKRDSTSDWTIRDASDVVFWRGGWPDPDLGADEVHGHLIVTHVQSGMDFCQTRIRNAAVDKRINLVSFCDRFINVRRHGHGV